ncbi:hypothetical protein [Faecalibaculum rodentium]|uniref:hypothetical protein n=1 Tax=Faecalibaculum rodentium TaxID=1702221 RepID=UPI001C3D6C4D|nr:hypothetical protein [Faecalibaculum rodentium]
MNRNRLGADDGLLAWILQRIHWNWTRELVCMGVRAVYSVLFTAFNRWLPKPPKAHS